MLFNSAVILNGYVFYYIKILKEDLSKCEKYFHIVIQNKRRPQIAELDYEEKN